MLLEDDVVVKAKPAKIFAVCNCRQTLIVPDEDGYVTGPDWCMNCNSAVARILEQEENNKRV